MRLRNAGLLTAALAAVFFAVFSAISVGGSGQAKAAWASRDLRGSVRLVGQIPRAVATGAAHPVSRHATNDELTLSFAFPLRNRASLARLIRRESTTHHYLTRAQVYARFAPPRAQVNALRHWLVAKGFSITHVGADRLAVAAKAPTTTVEKALHVRIDDFAKSAFTYSGVKVKPYLYYANTVAPRVPARLGLQSISGLSSVDRFFTDAQIYAAQHPGECSDDDATINPLCVDVRSGGYFPSDLQGLYDISGHGYNATGQTIGFTLWTTPERQAAMTAYANLTGDTPITVDPSCTATGNSPTTPSSCSSVQVQPDHLMTILENGNSDSNANFGSNVETALDIEASHGVATGAALKYYADGCAPNPEPGSGLSNAGCNGSDVGMEEAMEDAASDPTLHSVSNSWGYGGDPEWGLADPFQIATNNILQLAAAVGTSFYFSTGDAGTYQSGWPTDGQYVVSVGGTSLYSTSNSGNWSTSTEWNGSGSWCSNIISRPSWQTGPGLSAASCPGRVSPDVSADADPNTGVRFVASSNLNGGTSAGQVGGTSLAAPIMNGLQADTQNFVDGQTYPGGTAPQMGFVAPVLYQLGNGGHAASYFRDIQCGNTANPTSGPDGDATAQGWDPASGWGEPDWFQFATGYALELGATNLTVPPSLSQHFSWSCAQTPSNSTERSISCPTAKTCYAVGGASGGTPWYGKFLPSGVWGAANTFFESTDGGQTWFPSNSDMFSIACTTSSSCLEVGAGGRERRTTDGGSTWSDVATASGNNKPLTQVQCPSSSICYAAGDRGNVMKSTDGGQTWSWLSSTDGNPIYGLSCPTTDVCYATDIYAHVVKTDDGGSTWTWQKTPITTPGADQVAETGGPNPYAGLMSISCSDASTCVASGLYVVPTNAGQSLPSTDPPILTTTDGGANWVLRQSNGGVTPTGATTSLVVPAAAGATNIKVASVSGRVPGESITVDSTGASPEKVTIVNVGTAARTATTLAAASAAGDTNIKVTSVTNMVVGEAIAIDTGASQELDTIQSVGTAGATGTGVTLTTPLTLAHASGAAARDVGTGLDITPALAFPHASGATVAINAPNYLHSVSCIPGTTNCTAVGRNGAIVTTSDLTTWTAQTSGTTSFLNDVTCLSTSFCMAVGQSGTVDVYDGNAWTASTGNGGSGTLASVTCESTTACYATGKQGVTIATTDGGMTWAVQAGGGTTQQMNGVSCPDAGTCYAVGNAVGGASPAPAVILKTTNGGQTWLPQAGGGSSSLNGVACTSTSACVAVGAGGSARATTDGSTWNAGTTGTTSALNGVACSSPTSCSAVGAAGTALRSADGGATWTAQTSGTTLALNAVTCPSSTCYAAGSAGTVLKSTDGGTTWSALTSGTANQLNGVACVNDAYCFADGTFGTVIATNDGTTWTQQGNPLSGPTTALNATNLALNGAACTTARCLIAGPTQGNILDTPLLTVALNASGTYGSTPDVSGLASSNPAISYDPNAEAGNVTGTLSCSTTATQSSDVGTYPIASCSGLADDGFSVVYDYADSSYDVTKAPLTVTADDKSRTFGHANPPLTATLSGFVLGQTLATSGVTGSASCQTTATTFSSGGPYPITCAVGSLDSANYSFGPFVPGTLTVTYTSACLTGNVVKLNVAAGQAICLAHGAYVSGGATVQAGGSLDVEGATVTGGLKSSGAGVLRICGSMVTGGLKAAGSTGLALVGGDAATGTCTGNTITGGASITDGSGGVEFNGNSVSGGLTITGNTGTLPPPDTGPVHVSGNQVSGKSTIQS